MPASIRKYRNGVLQSENRPVLDGFLPLQEHTRDNSVLSEYTWGLSFGGGVGGLLDLKQGGQNYAYLYDGKGNVTALLNGGQAVVATYTYDAFGNIMSETGSLSQPFQFSTKPYDEQTGLSYFGYRFYSSILGRWITRDPIGYAGGLNLYAYVGNDPVNWQDPLGLKRWLYITGGVGGSLGVFSAEYGNYYLVDPLSGEYYRFGYLSGGPGLGIGLKRAGVATQLEVGVLENAPCDPTDISNWALTVSGFAALGLKGISGQITGTSFWGNGEIGATAGHAGGIGVSVSGMVTRSWFLGRGNVLPDEYREAYREFVEDMQ